MKANKCWAGHLGGCDVMSGEHVITHGVLRIAKGNVTTTGMHRVPDGDKNPAKLRANILCAKHNSALGLLDDEATRLAEFLSKIGDSSFEGEMTFDGALLERWLQKSSVNALASGWSSKVKYLPDPEVVRSIYGLRPMPAGCGLYLVDKRAKNQVRPLEYIFEPLWRQYIPVQSTLPTRTVLLGCFIGLNGLTFFGAFQPDAVHQLADYAVPGAQYPSWTYYYHPNGVPIERDGASTLMVRFDWSNLVS